MADVTRVKKGNAKLKLVGFGDMYKKLKDISPEASEAGVRVINKALDFTYTKSQALVPVDVEDGGQLKASGKKSKARVSKRSGNVTGSVQYGGPKLAKLAPKDSPLYAIVQHENTKIKHDIGEAKFLEKPALLAKAKMFKDLGTEISKAIDKLGRKG